MARVGTGVGPLVRERLAANRVVGALGGAAGLARRAGLERPFRRLVHAADAPFVAAGRPPLAADLRGLRFRGYLRHRSFLATDVRPETSYCELFESALRPGLTVVDGGAHLGAYAVLAARAVGTTGTVLAFEPDPYNFGALEHNVRRLAGGRVRLSRKALGAAPGSARFHLSSGTRGSSFHERGDTTGVVDVEMTTLDAELDALDLAGGLLVKLNVEGAEPFVLDGMQETLGRVEDVTVFVEAHPELLARSGTSAESLASRLELLGFSVGWVDVARGSVVPLELRRPGTHGHLYGVRRPGA
jgi:FkbM family methyltransferase